jgi:hypothetical protein
MPRVHLVRDCVSEKPILKWIVKHPVASVVEAQRRPVPLAYGTGPHASRLDSDITASLTYACSWFVVLPLIEGMMKHVELSEEIVDLPSPRPGTFVRS